MRACPRCGSTFLEEVEFCGLDGTRCVDVESDPLLGRTIDRYQVTELLGRGAMGSVYRARHLGLSRDFALKVLFGDLAANRSLIERFHREAMALSKLRHTNIVGVVDFLTTEAGLNVLIMEYLPGRPLDRLIDEEAPLLPGRAANIARQIALGLGEAHRAGIVHRDVKPSNVFLVPEAGGELVKLLDFGVVAVEEGPGQTRLTSANKVVGTPMYMAPEQVREGPVTASADLYALGVILFEMLTGRPPFEASSPTAVLVKHATEPAPPVPSAGGLERLCARLLAKYPEERPATADLVAEEIDAIVAQWSISGGLYLPPPRAASTPPLPPPLPVVRGVPLSPGPGEVPPGWLARHRRTLGLSLALGLGVALVTFTLLGEPPEPSSSPLAEERAAVLAPLPAPARSASVASRPPAREAAARAPSRLELERRRPAPGGRQLIQVLAERGLEQADLLLIPSTAPAARRYQATLKRRRNAELMEAAEAELVEVARVAPIPPRVIERRLDRFDRRLASNEARVPENLREELHDRYLGLRASLGNARTDEDRATILSRLRRLELDLDHLVTGRRASALR